ncbi:MAG: SUF system Fe-S cluster assembly regulator [Nevskiaceae bacterium]|nr:MAG: SUF system Fe-S cluster assembly regulator [Nevskiaceae bacterium]TBR74763.1 MAG: SUF system Fe-S cluster assembly regulator [Nevskiaceae bacterium]
MLKLGRLTDYATLVMTQLANEPCSADAASHSATRSAHDIAQRAHLAPPTVAKLLRQLARAGLVEAERGAYGGYRLARAAAQITVADIVTAIEGPVALTECATAHSRCSIQQRCGVRGSWRLINAAIEQALQAVTLQQMADSERLLFVRLRPATTPVVRAGTPPAATP